MISIFKHITKIPVLSLLVVAGLGFAQLHEAVHAADTIQFHAKSDNEDSSSDQYEDVCLACSLTFSALTGAVLSANPDYSLKEILTFPADSFINSAATTHFRLRAPPVI